MDHVNAAEFDLRKRTSDQSFRRGEEYFQRGAVRSVVREGDTIHAEVAGSAPWPYQVQTEWAGGRLIAARCDCPYGFGDFCKHIVATALTVIRHPDHAEEREPLGELLQHLNRDQLESIVLALAGSSPAYADRIRSLIARTGAVTTAGETPDDTRASRPIVDLAQVKRRVHQAFSSLYDVRPSNSYWHETDVTDQIAEIIDDAPELAASGWGDAALDLLDAVTREYLESWSGLDDSEDEAIEFLWELGDTWAEVLLILDLSAEQREDLLQHLDEFSAELMDYGMEDAFYPALVAAEQSWDDPDIQAAMNGEIIADSDLPQDPLIPIRLNVLARQERFDEFLNLARASSHFESYLHMLVYLGRTDEAVQQSFTLLPSADATLSFVNLLQERGNEQQALAVGRHGLTLPGERHYLASWVRDEAGLRGDTELALQAGVIAFQTFPSLDAYVRVRQYASSDWPEYRQRLLERLRTSDNVFEADAVEVFLYEGLITDAMRVVDQSYFGGLWVETVAKAAVETEPEWVIDKSLTRADEIMNAGRSSDYQEAAEWMSLAKSAFQSTGRQREWNELLSERLERHHRKYKLRPLLEQLVD